MAIEISERTVTSRTVTFTEDASDGSKMTAVVADGSVSLAIMGAAYTFPVADAETVAGLLAAIAQHEAATG